MDKFRSSQESIQLLLIDESFWGKLNNIFHIYFAFQKKQGILPSIGIYSMDKIKLIVFNMIYRTNDISQEDLNFISNFINQNLLNFIFNNCNLMSMDLFDIKILYNKISAIQNSLYIKKVFLQTIGGNIDNDLKKIFSVYNIIDNSNKLYNLIHNKINDIKIVLDPNTNLQVIGYDKDSCIQKISSFNSTSLVMTSTNKYLDKNTLIDFLDHLSVLNDGKLTLGSIIDKIITDIYKVELSSSHFIQLKQQIIDTISVSYSSNGLYDKLVDISSDENKVSLSDMFRFIFNKNNICIKEYSRSYIDNGKMIYIGGNFVNILTTLHQAVYKGSPCIQFIGKKSDNKYYVTISDLHNTYDQFELESYYNDEQVKRDFSNFNYK